MCHREDFWAKFGTHRNHPHQIWGVLGGKTIPVMTPIWSFLALWFHMLIIFFPVSSRKDFWKKIGTNKNHPYQTLGILGGQACNTTPGNDTKMTIFLLKHDQLTTYPWDFTDRSIFSPCHGKDMWKTFGNHRTYPHQIFSHVMKGCGQNLSPTGTIPSKFWGSWGIKPPPVMIPTSSFFG